MTNIERVRDELLNCADDAFSRGLFMLFDCLLDAGDDHISTSYGNLGINCQNGTMEFVDIESGVNLLTLEVV
ncbi:MAG: hypothetical protein J6C58_07395 [Bacteroidaceae bacterium]|nr:hypothetical protein [Bacteroidaceae bacterium]